MLNRILELIDDGTVTFRWKDYRDDNAQKTMTLEAVINIVRSRTHERIAFLGG